MTCTTFRVPGHFLATLFHVVREHHSALWHFSSRSDEYIHNSATVKIWQEKSFSLPPPSQKMCRCQQLRCGTLICIQHVWNPLSTGLLAVQWARKHTSYNYSHFCCNCYAHQDASSLSTAQTCSTSLICCGCQHTTARSIFCILPPITNGIHLTTHPKGTVSQNGARVTSPLFKASSSSHGIFTSRKWKFITLSTTIHKKRPCSLSQSTIQLIMKWTQLRLTIPPSALLGQCYIPHPVSVAKWHNHTGNQLKRNCIHGTVLVKLYSSHFAGEMVGEKSS
jgi:hypothetical protein